MADDAAGSVRSVRVGCRRGCSRCPTTDGKPVVPGCMVARLPGNNYFLVF